MAETGKVQKVHGCIGCSIVIVLVVLCSFAASLPAAIRMVRYTNGVNLECATGELEVPPFQQQVVYIIPPDNCWTDWIASPKGQFRISADSTVDEELFFTDGSSQVFQNFPGKEWPPLPMWTKLRFRNGSSGSIKITIRTRN